MYLRCDKKTLSRLSRGALRHLMTELVEFPESTKPDFDMADVHDYMRSSGGDFYLHFCPCCGVTGFVGMFGGFRGMFGEPGKPRPFACGYCGETDPLHKADACLKKVSMLQDLITAIQEDKVGVNDCEKKVRVLLEQCIVQLATGLELFLRDTHAILMNIRFVKNSKSLYSRFHSESRNAFTNIGKASKKYKEDLGINLREKLTRREIQSLTLLVCKRHVIVHNNGVVDQTFLNQTGSDIETGEIVSIQPEEVMRDIGLLRRVMKVIGSYYYKREVGRELVRRVNRPFADAMGIFVLQEASQNTAVSNQRD